MDALFPWLLFLHILGAIIAFGPGFVFPILGAAAGREPQHANFASRVSLTVSDRIVVPVGLTIFISGFGMIAVRGIDVTSAHWLSGSIVIYAAAFLFSILVQRPTVKRIIELTTAPPVPGASGPPPELRAAVKASRRNGLLLTLAMIVVLFMMVVKPGA